MNPARERLRLVLTKNAADKLAEAIAASGMTPEIVDPRRFRRADRRRLGPSGRGAGGAAAALGQSGDVCTTGNGAPLVVLLDRVTDPHNVGAILRSAEVFGARAVIAPHRHSAPETGALAKTASGALERQPYLRVTNLADAMETLKAMGFVLLGLDGEADGDAGRGGWREAGSRPVGIVLGAEGPGLREKTRETCDRAGAHPLSGWLRLAQRFERRGRRALCGHARMTDAITLARLPL